MAWKAWALFAAVASGFAAASGPGGAPYWARFVLLAALLLALATTIAAIVTGRRPTPSWRESVDPIELAQRRVEADQEIVDELMLALDPRTIVWLQAQTFDTPWRDSAIAPIRATRRALTESRAAFADGLAEALDELLQATTGFLEYYEVHTRFDPLVHGGDWREVSPDERQESGGKSSARENPSSRLVDLASSLVGSYDHLLGVAWRVPSMR